MLKANHKSFLTTKEDIKSYIYEWNFKYPIDRWWRKKYGVAFLSERHKSASFFDMIKEYQEDQIFDNLQDGADYEEGKWITIKESTPEDQARAYKLAKEKYRAANGNTK